MEPLNWAKILGNTISAFAIVAISINIAGAPNELIAAFYAAGITALLAFAKELQECGKTEEEMPSKIAPLLLF